MNASGMNDQHFMQRCLDLAGKGLGTTYPNPLVGSVVVYDEKVIGEGFHYKSGQPHAEVVAVSSVEDKALLKKATLYVNLEPCAHYGKTPPCAPMIVSYSIPRVVIGTTDTHARVSGRGIEILKQGGCEVVTGVLEKESRWINRRFFTFHEKQRPYIILKWAESHDGFIDKKRVAGEPKGPTWISGPLGRQLVHKWRSEEQAILIGTRTALVDDPQLTVRHWTGSNPLRLVIDRKLVLPRSLRMFGDGNPVVMFNQQREGRDGNLHYVRIDFEKETISQILDYLYDLGKQSLIVEGGAETLMRFVSSGLWDEARVFRGRIEFGDGVKAPQTGVEPLVTRRLPDSEIQFYYHPDHFNPLT